jgi:hypothetical protein
MTYLDSTGAGPQKSLWRSKRASNLKSSLILFDSTTTLQERPSNTDVYDSTFTLNVLQSNTSGPLPSTKKRSLFIDLGLPTLLVILPLTLLSAALVGLIVYGWQRIG